MPLISILGKELASPKDSQELLDFRRDPKGRIMHFVGSVLVTPLDDMPQHLLANSQVSCQTGCCLSSSYRNWAEYLTTHDPTAISSVGALHPGQRILHRSVAAWTQSYLFDPEVGIPEDLTVDHLCRTRACHAESHLEWVTYAENTERMQRALPLQALIAKLSMVNSLDKYDIETLRICFGQDFVDIEAGLKIVNSGNVFSFEQVGGNKRLVVVKDELGAIVRRPNPRSAQIRAMTEAGLGQASLFD